MEKQEVILRFSEVSFAYGPGKPILHEADFSLRRGAKFALMGQNGAGKTTLFQLISKELEPDSGAVHMAANLTIATERQVIPREQIGLSPPQFF